MAAHFVRLSPGAVGRIASFSGVDRTSVSHWFSEDAERRYVPPLDALEPLLDEIGPEFLRPAFGDRGLGIVPIARPTTSPVPLEIGIWDLLERAAGTAKEVHAAATDRRIDEQEAQRVRSQLVALMDVCQGMLSRLPEPVR